MRICPQCGAETTALTCRNDGFGTVDAARYRRLDPSHLLGTLFQDRYRVDAVLGSGGMGSVFRATQVRVGRLVALKVINADLAYDLAVVARFQREGRAIATLIHPNIVQVYDFGQTDDGELFMAMELVLGRTLADVIREEAPLDPSRVVQIGSQIFDALAEAHEHGVIHRDLKPENIFITETGRRRDMVKILDFGVAKIVNEPKSESMVTARGAILGSPKYMAPEQARGKGVTGHADLYAAGGILYEMLTGQAVLNEPSPADYLVAHSVKMPSPPSVNGRELRGPLVDLVMKCLEKKPWNRPDGSGRALEAMEAARLMPLVEPGDNAPVLVRAIPPDQDEAPRRVLRPAAVPDTLTFEAPTSDAAVRSIAVESPPALPGMTATAAPSRTTPLLEPEAQRGPAATPILPGAALAEPEVDEEDERPRVVAPGIVRIERPPVPAAVETIMAADTRRLSAHDPLTYARISGAQTEPTIIAPADTAEALKVVHIAERGDGRRSGGLWMLAATLLLFVGAFVYLAANNFFRGDAGNDRVAASDLRRVVADPVQAGGLGPAAPGPSAAAPVAASPTGPMPGEPLAVAGGDHVVPESGAVAEAEAGANVAGDLGANPRDLAATVKATAAARVVAVDQADPAAPEANPTAETAAASVADPAVKRAAANVADPTVKSAAASDADAAAKSHGDVTPNAAKDKPAWVEQAARTRPASAVHVASQQTNIKAPINDMRGIDERTVLRRTTAPTSAARTPDPLADLEDTDFPGKTDPNNNIHQVLVDSNPSGAEIRMGSLPLGRTPLRVEWKDLGHAVNVTITKEGFSPSLVTLSPAQASLNVKLKPVMMQAPEGN